MICFYTIINYLCVYVCLIDCNNFYVSCERVFRPDLRNKPIVIFSNNDGCVISRSDETKLLQLPMGSPIHVLNKICIENDIYVISSTYSLYGDMSSRVISILKKFTCNIEVYSIDESFLFFDRFITTNFSELGFIIRKRILKWTGIPTSVGIAPTKGLAKITNKIARRDKLVNDVYVINSEEKRIQALLKTKIEDVWGIGRRLSNRLRNSGCETALDFANLAESYVKKEFSVVEARLHRDLNGIPTLKLEDHSPDKKMIATTRSFEKATSDLNEIKERVSTFATNCGQKLRKQGSSCHAVIVMLRSNKFDSISQQDHQSRLITLSYPSNSTLTLSSAAVSLVSKMYKKGISYKKAGVIVTGLIPEEYYQLNIFENEDPRHKSLIKSIYALNDKYGRYKIKLGNQDLKRTWKMNQEFLTPKYTTNIKYIIVVK